MNESTFIPNFHLLYIQDAPETNGNDAVHETKTSSTSPPSTSSSSETTSKSSKLSQETTTTTTAATNGTDNSAQHTNGSNGHAKFIPDDIATAVEVIDDEDEGADKKLEAKKLLDDYIRNQKQQKNGNAGRGRRHNRNKRHNNHLEKRENSNDRSVKVSFAPLFASIIILLVNY